MKKIFVATPITLLLDEDGCFDSECKDRLSHILATLKDIFQAEIFCAIEREKWGDAVMPGDFCTPLDLQGLRESDVVLAFALNSYGVHVELGWASALNKPIIFLNNKTYGFYSPLTEGLHTITSTEYFSFDDILPFPCQKEWSEQLIPQIGKVLAERLK